MKEDRFSFVSSSYNRLVLEGEVRRALCLKRWAIDRKNHRTKTLYQVYFHLEHNQWHFENRISICRNCRWRKSPEFLLDVLQLSTQRYFDRSLRHVSTILKENDRSMVEWSSTLPSLPSNSKWLITSIRIRAVSWVSGTIPWRSFDSEFEAILDQLSWSLLHNKWFSLFFPSLARCTPSNDRLLSNHSRGWETCKIF